MAFEYSNSGQVKILSCSEYMGQAKDSMSFNYDFKMSLTTFMGSPLIKSNLTWQHNVLMNQACIIPYGQKEALKVSIERKQKKEIYPYQAKVLLQLSSENYLSNKNIFLLLDPGVLSEYENEESFNTPAVKDWNKLFFTLSKNYLNTRESIENNAKYLSAKDAKKYITSELKVVSMRTIDERFNLAELKLHYAKELERKKNNDIVKIAQKFYNWMMTEFPSDPENLTGLFKGLQKLPYDRAITQLNRLLEKVTTRDLQGNTYNTTAEQHRAYSLLQREIAVEHKRINNQIELRKVLRLNRKEENNIYDEIYNKRFYLEENQIDLTQGPLVIEEDTRVYLACQRGANASILLEEGFELNTGVEIERPGSGISNVRVINNSIAYMCQKNSREHFLKVVDLDSNILLKHQVDDNVQYYIVDPEEDVSLKNNVKVIMAGNKLLSVNIFDNGHNAYVDVIDSKNEMKIERIELQDSAGKTSMVSATKDVILSYHHNRNKNSVLNITNIKSKKVNRVSLRELNWIGNDQLKFFIQSTDEDTLLVHVYSDSDTSGRRFFKSLVINGPNIIEMSNEKLDEIPND